MSYILEALQKSEHERQRGKVPDLNTNRDAGSAFPAKSRRWPHATTLAVMVALALLGWWRPWDAPAPSQPTPAQPVVQTRPAASEPPPQAALSPTIPQAPQTPPKPQTSQMPAVSVPPMPATPRVTPAETSARGPAAAPGRTAPSTPEIPAARRAEAATPRSPDNETSPAARANDTLILNLDQLPAAVRSSLPRLAISGYAYAGDSDKRMVVINDRLVQEGEEAAPGVTLAALTKDGIVFAFKGYRFRSQP